MPLFFFKSAKQGTSIYLTASYFNGNSAPGYGGARFGSDDILNSGSSQPVYISSDCAAGTFNDGDGSIIDCNECPDTSMPANLLNTACKVCEPGNWSQDGALTCYPVPKPTAAHEPTPVPTALPTNSFPAPTNDGTKNNDDDNDDDGPDTSVVQAIGDAAVDYWSTTKDLFKDLWNRIF